VEESAKPNYIGLRPMAGVERKSSVSVTWNSPMKETENIEPKFAVCIDNREYPASLELHKIYRILPDEEAARDGDVRIIDESGEDYLYPAEWFVVIDVPEDVEASLLQAS
jgi:hypothetical protein